MTTQICAVLVLVLMIMLVSGMIGWRIGYDRCIENIREYNIKALKAVRNEESENSNGKVCQV